MFFGGVAPARVVFPECAKHKKRVVRLDAVFLKPHVLSRKAVAQQEILDGPQRHIAVAEKQTAKLILEIAMQVHGGALRVDEHATGIVLQEKGNKQAFVRHTLPFAASAGLHAFPSLRPIVKARVAGDTGRNGVWPHGHTVQFHQAHGRAPYLRGRRVLNQPFELEHPEAAEEKIYAHAGADGRIDDDLALVMRGDHCEQQCYSEGVRHVWGSHHSKRGYSRKDSGAEAVVLNCLISAWQVMAASQP